MVNIYYNFYVDVLNERNNELNFCFNKLLYNKYIDNIYVILNNNDYSTFKDKYDNVKIKDIKFIKDRPTYNDFFEVARKYSGDFDGNVIINSDCFIDYKDTMKINFLEDNVFYCQSRLNITRLKPFLTNRDNLLSFSQDAWLFKGKPKNINAEIYMGIKNCDSVVAYEAKKTGYDLKNLPLEIKIYHYHFTYPDREIQWLNNNYNKLSGSTVEVNYNKKDYDYYKNKMMDKNNNMTIKNICENYLLNPGDFIVFLNDMILYNSFDKSKNNIKFYDDYFMIKDKKYSYKNIKIKKIL